MPTLIIKVLFSVLYTTAYQHYSSYLSDGYITMFIGGGGEADPAKVKYLTPLLLAFL